MTEKEFLYFPILKYQETDPYHYISMAKLFSLVEFKS